MNVFDVTRKVAKEHFTFTQFASDSPTLALGPWNELLEDVNGELRLRWSCRLDLKSG